MPRGRERVVDVDQRIIGAAEQAVRQRNYRRARERALTRLGREFPEAYARLLEEERERDLKEGKAWTSIRGRADNSLNAVGRTARKSQPGKSNQASGDDSKQESNVGGEA